MRAALAGALCAATLAALPSTSVAQGCVGQPGTSALEQYCEAVPRGDGGRDRPGSGSGSGSSGNGGSGVSGATRQQLQGAGADGAAVAALASGGSGGSGSSGGSSKKPSQPSNQSSDAEGDAGAVKGISVDGPQAPDGSPLKAATQAASSGPVAGQAVTWGLVGLTALGAIGAVFMRRRQLGDAAAPDAGDQQ